jgi:hypothetical protein
MVDGWFARVFLGREAISKPSGGYTHRRIDYVYQTVGVVVGVG